VEFSKSIEQAPRRPARHSSQALQPSVCVLMMMVSSVLPGSTAQRLSVGVSGWEIALSVRRAEAPDAASCFRRLPWVAFTHSAGTLDEGEEKGRAWSSALPSEILFQM
jgi:hypothetical protein